jgi:DNA-binding NarL/FixJ family response regulator
MKIPYSRLTKREREVLYLIAKEFKTPEIAQRLAVSPKTIISHRRSLKRKLNARNTAGVIYKAFENAILGPSFIDHFKYI